MHKNDRVVIVKLKRRLQSSVIFKVSLDWRENFFQLVNLYAVDCHTEHSEKYKQQATAANTMAHPLPWQGLERVRV